MTTLVIDTEPEWLAHWQAEGADTSTFIPDAATLSMYDAIIVSERMEYHKLPRLSFIVATSQCTTKGAVKAYGYGARDYITKEFK